MSPLTMLAVTTVAFLVAATAAAPTSAVTTAAALPFRADYAYDSTARKFYKQHRTSTTWKRARDICRREGAELANPDTPQQLQALGVMQRHLTLSEEPADMWIGIFHTSILRTVYNETVNIMGLNDGSQRGVYLSANGSQFVADSAVALPFACEIPEAAACDASVPGYTLGPDALSCYKLHTDARNWTDALMACEAEGAQLAIINSQQEAEHLVGLIPTTSTSRHTLVGFHELFEKGRYFTVDGHPLASSGYEDWNSGEPNNHKGVIEKCGSMRETNGKLNDIDCSAIKPYICEKKASAPVSASSDCPADESSSGVVQIYSIG